MKILLRIVQSVFTICSFVWRSWFGFLLWNSAQLDVVSYFEVPRTDMKVVFTLKRDDWVTLVRTEAEGQLCMLSFEENNGVIPIARSYDGYGWEKAGGGFAGRLEHGWICTGPQVCTTLLPKGRRFVLRTRQVQRVTNDAAVARFLESASFGATTTDLETWGGRQREDYLFAQMYSEPPTFHREYFRRRANSVWMINKKEAAGALNPCAQQSAWRRQVITVWDRKEMLRVDRIDQRWKVSIRGQVRTMVEEIGFIGSPNLSVEDGKEYQICSTDNEIRRGIHELLVGSKCRRLKDLLIDFPLDYEPNMLNGTLPSLQEAKGWKRTSEFVPEYFLQTNVVESFCSHLPKPIDKAEIPIFARTSSGEWMQHDPRLVLQRNTPQDPQSDGGLANLSKNKTQLCSNVRRNFLNEESCIMSSIPACHQGSSSSTKPSTGIMVCGSPGEIDNDPSLGDQWLEFCAQESRGSPALNLDQTHTSQQRESIWSQIALSATDQLRQRAAWSLFQIFALPKTDAVGNDGRVTEPFLNYYDVFVRNAFGNYRQILIEMVYHPLMSRSLSYLDSASTSYVYEGKNKLSFPDENFARELMQLFTIGLVRLNKDGTPIRDANNRTIRSYGNENIASFSRVWTGFHLDTDRSNVEGYAGNYIDPLRIDPEKRDRFPKPSLDHEGYLGDRYPLCEDLPPRPFLRRGAKYRLLGSHPSPELIHDNFEGVLGQEVARLNLDDQNSRLYDSLCSKSTAEGKCTFPAIVILAANIPCYGDECVDMVRVVKVGSVFYEHIQTVPCVQYAFLQQGVKVAGRNRSRPSVCASPNLPLASEACCDSKGYAVPSCIYGGERMTMSTASSRCALIGRSLCDYRRLIPTVTCPHEGHHWTGVDCKTKVKVDGDGMAAVVHDLENPSLHVGPGSPNFFQVFWKDGLFPVLTGETCGTSSCENLDGYCVCDVEVVDRPVFTSPPQNATSIFERLTVGHASLKIFDTGAFLGSTMNGYRYFSNDSGCCDSRTFFEIFDPRTGRTVFLKNTESTVFISGTKFQFRNPPHFNKLVPSEFTVSDAEQETFALIDHLLFHPNTAPFVAYRIIQRFGISNPTPRYVGAVSEAFRIGKYTSRQGFQFGDGEYGDLAATFAAVFLDREADSLVLDGDPFSGSLREPVLKVLAFLRAMEFRPAFPFLDLHMLDERIGQSPYEQKTVFSFFRAEYSPPGEAALGEIVAPEAEVMSNGKVIGLLNGLFSLVRNGLSRCENGLGRFSGCGAGQNSGMLEYSPRGDLSRRGFVIGVLSDLLTCGRLEYHKIEMIRELVDEENDEKAWKTALQLIVTTPEFHSSNKPDTLPHARTVIGSQPPKGKKNRKYKAVIHLSLRGGLDSFNMLVPMDCPLRQSYKELRDTVALSDEELLPLNGDAESQPCKSFGIHHRLSYLKELYDGGDAAFLANVGVLSEPVNRADYRIKTVTELFAHNAMQAEIDRLDPFNQFQRTGTLGRMAEILFVDGYRTSRTSVEAAPGNLAGQLATPPPVYSLDQSGVVPLDTDLASPVTQEVINALNGGPMGNRSGVFGELWSSILHRSLNQTDRVHYLLQKNTQTVGNFSRSPIGKRFKLISQLIKTRDMRDVDRDHFFVEFGGWDHHFALREKLDEKFTELDTELRNLVTELKASGAWNDVVIMETSDFARTLTPNTGGGTDHGYGGIAFIAGGGIDGGRILGEYPSLSEDLNVGRGRIIPTMPWEAPFNAIAEWMGIRGDDLDLVLPNRRKFPKLFRAQDLFSIRT